MILLAVLMAAAVAAVVVLIPVAAVIEWRNSRPERGSLPLVGDPYHAARRRPAPTGKLFAARAADRVRRDLAWVWDNTGTAVRMADGMPVGWQDHQRPIGWQDGRPVWKPRWTLTAA